ncbi:hypothetical protein NLM27_42365 [Bradyrhizobium sp. CCGB12]|uniref:hypothetical protein n=1 Tax=Bradyrhizobium sp. CCGB12 TaxID=2949632 RepID=UPI0020B20CDB|nr:hypothetical protein [Bradyrhizobium sp. CCGB12]MCP3395368.1 hypothetical protein [Bradyrhizobium sp. CCGB12]
MKMTLSTTALQVLLATSAVADEIPQPKIQQVRDSATEAADCSKQVWPHFSDACLRSEGKGISVRVVTTERR